MRGELYTSFSDLSAKFTNCRQFKTRDAKSLGFSENCAGKAHVLQEKIICRPFGRRIASTAALFVSRRPRGPAGVGGLYNERKSS